MPIIMSREEGEEGGGREGGKGNFIRVIVCNGEHIWGGGGGEFLPHSLEVPSSNSLENYFPPLIMPLVIRVWPLLIDSLNFSG